MIHDPEILILDEPTAGVDVELRRSLWTYLGELNRQGKTVLLTTHYIEEAEALCDEVAIIDRGRIVAQDAPQRLVEAGGERRIEIALAAPPPPRVFPRRSDTIRHGSRGGCCRSPRLTRAGSCRGSWRISTPPTSGSTRCGSSSRAWRRSSSG